MLTLYCSKKLSDLLPDKLEKAKRTSSPWMPGTPTLLPSTAERCWLPSAPTTVSASFYGE